MAACGVMFLALAVIVLSIEFWTRVRPDPVDEESVDEAARTGTWKSDF